MTQLKQIGPVVINRSIHTARKQHQRKNVLICVASRVLCELGLMCMTTFSSVFTVVLSTPPLPDTPEHCRTTQSSIAQEFYEVAYHCRTWQAAG